MSERIDHEAIRKIAEAFLAEPSYTADPAAHPFLPEVLHLSRAYLAALAVVEAAQAYIFAAQDPAGAGVGLGALMQLEDDLAAAVAAFHRGAPVGHQEGKTE